MADDIKNVQAVKSAIEILLEIVRNIYNADVAALFLVIRDMHEDEKLYWFNKRLEMIQKAYGTKTKEEFDAQAPEVKKRGQVCS